MYSIQYSLRALCMTGDNGQHALPADDARDGLCFSPLPTRTLISSFAAAAMPWWWWRREEEEGGGVPLLPRMMRGNGITIGRRLAQVDDAMPCAYYLNCYSYY
ncbi:hypothetical protein TraAM80_08992 [Trypanosoma rangeli]|uniref:Uncharacterized protein n=1 Tax=Trypanosoma rangeli TaxID=5698 RepID=A0A3R7JWS0_TRYRA|nr:uncharacterized protein TraAM80_08992 [Trypanosoma rangeli]RNE98059.1 hypothetical protein TraAM80_08992 [Trypanosoma rangeli]|eukprot:RNE98059.1 hypothetical protein TraAM80_08992 [Trypanosoma rangeli]